MAYRYSPDTGFELVDVSLWHDSRIPFVEEGQDPLELAFVLPELDELDPQRPPKQLTDHALVSDGFDALRLLPEDVSGMRTEVLYADLSAGALPTAVRRRLGQASLIGYSAAPSVRHLHEQGLSRAEITGHLVPRPTVVPGIASEKAVDLDTPLRSRDPLQMALYGMAQAVLATGEARGYDHEMFVGANDTHLELTAWHLLGRFGQSLYDRVFADRQSAMQPLSRFNHLALVVPPWLKGIDDKLRAAGMRVPKLKE